MSPLSESKTYRGHIALFLFAAFVMLTSADISSAQTLDRNFEEYLDAAQRVLNFSGAVLVAKDGQVLFTKGYGMADISSSRPNAPETKYMMGSVTKQFTATAIMQLAEKKLLNLDDPIGKHLPDYPQPAAEGVTIYHLLTHTSGITEYTDLPRFDEMYTKAVRPEDVVSIFKDLPLLFEAGSEWRYSNSGYYLLGFIIEKVSGETYGEYMRKHVFEPLGMSNTSFPHGFADLPGSARGHRFDSASTLAPEVVVHSNLPYSAGGLYSTVGDMAKWDRGLRNGTLLSPESLTRMFTPYKDHYGCGWFIDTLYGHQLAFHGGGGGGFRSSFMRFVDEPFCVVVFGNNDAGSVDRIGNGLAAIACGQPYDVPTIRTPIAIESGILEDYVGDYEAGPDKYRLVTREGDSLFVQRTSGARSLLHAEAKDKFFYDSDHSVTLTFVRGTAGKVTEQIIHQNGRDERARRIEGEKAQEILGSLIPATVDPAIYDTYAGDYEVAPGFVITFRSGNGRLFAQPTGQPEAEAFPRSETEFFFKLVDASVSFMRDSTGTVTGMVLRQGGRELPAKKVR
jgi:CubicO group peptidase (beta-lactamase class C family)